MYHKALKNNDKIFAVAPMMDWTDRHCRFFHRLFSTRALLYTEMVVADALIHGDQRHHLQFHDAEHPVALQLGGSDPEKLAKAAKIGADFGYDEINLNVGCPSDRVQSGTFGACLMREPELVARCVATMKEVVDVPVTVKCRIGVDDQAPEVALWKLVEDVEKAGADAVWVHARKAWLEGLSPKENRDIPPLNYGLIYQLKSEKPHLFIGINGGIDTLSEVSNHLDHCDGAMLGRAAYHTPAILAGVDALMQDGTLTDDSCEVDYPSIIDAMADYCDRHIANGGRLSHVTRHMVGLFHGVPGARRFRQILSTEAVREGANSSVLRRAADAVDLQLEPRLPKQISA